MTTEISTTDIPVAAPPLTKYQLEIVRMLKDGDPNDVLKAVSYLPTNIYSSPERFLLEREKLFRGRPVPIEVSAALPKPKMYMVNDDYGTSILLTRDDQGIVRAFANVCRHRCVQLSREKEAKSGGLIVCPYHAWTYNLKGNLVGVPREDVFPGLDRSNHKLVPLECVEAGGLIYVNPEPTSKADFTWATGALADEFNAIGLPQQILYKKSRFEIAANWKFVHDAFLESYHVPRLHSKSLAGMFTDRATACVEIGPHILQSSGRVGYKGETGSTISAFAEFRDKGVFSYTVISSAVIITSPTYINVMLMSPQSHDKTVVNYYMLVDRMPETEAEIARCEKSMNLMERVTSEEDLWVSELGTIGAGTGAVSQMILGGMEQDIMRFHRNIDQILGVQE
jgi:phenylpropionate dioxygenase-like ring-hydroxylating dioxygenase large terminal subunit